MGYGEERPCVEAGVVRQGGRKGRRGKFEERVTYSGHTQAKVHRRDGQIHSGEITTWSLAMWAWSSGVSFGHQQQMRTGS